MGRRPRRQPDVTVGLEPFSDPITPSDQPAMLDRPALTVLTTSTIPFFTASTLSIGTL
jgi:hypothetical protein